MTHTRAQIEAHAMRLLRKADDIRRDDERMCLSDYLATEAHKDEAALRCAVELMMEKTKDMKL